ncbi:MAG: hypothetical protein GX970_08040, partial [Phyllobacteriaceae bacterium]|nr:hypothetical protein [Phyllobacteriaceae bacterium]
MSFPEDNDPFLSLKSAPTPAPRDDARARALAAGAAAFAATQENSKKTEMPTQGNGWRQRLMSIISSFKRISIMDTRIPLGTAAIALLILPLGWQFYSSTSMTPADFARQINQPSVAETAPAAPVVVRAPEATALAAPQKQVDVAQQAVPAPPRAEMEIAMEAAPDMVMPAPQSMGAPSPSITSRMAQQSVQTMGINPNAGSAMMDASGVYLPPSQATEASGDSFTSFDEQRLKV